MLEIYNNILVVESSALGKNEMNYLRRTKQINIVRRSAPGQKALISYHSLPSRIQERVKEQIGVDDPYDAVRDNVLYKYIRQSVEVSQWFEDYRLEDGRFLPKKNRIEYYNNAIVLDAIGRLLEEKRAIRRSKGKRLSVKWEEIAEGVSEIDKTCIPHNLPFNHRKLKNKFDEYKKKGYESLISKKFSNSNASKVDDKVKKSIMVELLADPRNLDNEQVATLYNSMATQMNWKSITGSAVSVWRDKYSTEIYAGRRGSSAFRNTKTMQIKRSAPTQPLYYWTLDGWDAELLYQKTEIRGGNSITTYHNRPTVVVVLDACLKYPMGYAIGTHETPELILEALRDATKHTQQLFGKMYRTHQIQSDRYAIKKMMPIYEAVGDKVTPARAHNAKAKIIEPYFNRINKKYCQLLPNWSGFGITSDREKQPNVEFLQKYKKNFPDFDGVKKQISEILDRERLQSLAKMQELWAELPAGKKLELDWNRYLLYFGETNGYTQRMTGSGLAITIAGERRVYDCFDLDMRRAMNEDWTVRYDRDDLTKVLAVNADETLRFEMEAKYIQPMALADRQEGDAPQLQRVKEYNINLEEYVTDFRSEARRTLDEAMEEVPVLRDTLSKLLITDSRGQHKSVKAKARLLAEGVEAEELVKDGNSRLEWLKSKVDLSSYSI